MRRAVMAIVTSAELKAKWIEALRSGKYKQGQGLLYRGDGEGSYCCLGVYGVVAGMNLNGLLDVGYLPPQRRDLVGLSGEVQNELISMNDDQGKSFDEIASWIETHDLNTGLIFER